MSTEISATKSPTPHRWIRRDSISALEREATSTEIPSSPVSTRYCEKGQNENLQTPELVVRKRGSSVYSTDEKPLPAVKFRQPLVMVDAMQDENVSTLPSPIRMSKSYPVLSQYTGDGDERSSYKSSLEESSESRPPTLSRWDTQEDQSRASSGGTTILSGGRSLSRRIKGMSRKSFSTVRLYSRSREGTAAVSSPLDMKETESEAKFGTMEQLSHFLTLGELQDGRQDLARAQSQKEPPRSWARRTAEKVFWSASRRGTIAQEAERIFGPAILGSRTPSSNSMEPMLCKASSSTNVPIRHVCESSDSMGKPATNFPAVSYKDFNDTTKRISSSNPTGHGFVFDPFRKVGSVQADLKENGSTEGRSAGLSIDTIRKIYLRLLLENAGHDWIKTLRELRRLPLVELERLALQTFRVINVQPILSNIDFYGFFHHHTYPTWLKWVHCKRLTVTVSEKADCFAVYQHVKTIGERVFVYSTKCPANKKHGGPRTVAPYFVGYLEIGHKAMANVVADIAITAWGDTKVLLAVLNTDGKVDMACFNLPKTRLSPDNGQLDWNERSVRAAPTAYTMFVPRQQCERIKFTRDASLLLFSKGTITVHNYNSHERFTDGEQRQIVYRFANYTGHKTTASSFDRESAMSYLISIDVSASNLIKNIEKLTSNQSLTSVAHDDKLFMLPGCYRPVLLVGDLTRAAIVTTVDPPAIKVMRSSYFWYNETQPRLETRVYDWQLRMPSYGRGFGVGVDNVHSYAGAWLRTSGHAYGATEIFIAVAFWNGEIWIFGADAGTVSGYDPLYVEDGLEWQGIMEPGAEYLKHLDQEAQLVCESTHDQPKRQGSTRGRTFSGEGPVPLLSNPAASNAGFSDCPRLLQGRLLVRMKSTPVSMHFEVPQNCSMDFKQYGRTGLVVNTTDRTIERYYFPGFGGEAEYQGEVWNQNWTLSTVPDEKNSDVYHAVNGIYRKGRDQVVGVQVEGNNWII